MSTWGGVSLVANPGGEQVVHGDATFQRNGNVLTVDQGSNTAIINWQDFSIGTGETTRFLQNGPEAAVLNRVLGADPSALDGLLEASGSVYLINPNGIMVGPQGRIDTGAFFASTLDVADADFLDGNDLRFAGGSTSAIANLGEINARDGDIVLIARSVDNAGTLTAGSGVAALAAGTNVLLTPLGDQRVMIETDLAINAAEVRVDNSGLIQAARAELQAAGGDIYDLAINQEGTIRATGVEHRNGRILLTAAGRTVRHAGTSQATDHDGSGGEILIGGDYQGANSAIANAGITDVTADSVLDANATAADADGGRIIVWADQATRFEGALTADAGPSGGDGGFAEVSGKRSLEFKGRVSLDAPGGEVGTLLLDPDALTISAAPTSGGFDVTGTTSQNHSATSTGSVLNVTELETLLATVNMTVRSSLPSTPATQDNGIIIDAPISWASGRRLSIYSGSFIDINADIDAGGAPLTLGAGNFLAATGVTDNVHLDANASITAGTLILTGSSVTADQTLSRGSVNLEGAIHVSTFSAYSPDSTWGSFSATNAANTITNLETSGLSGGMNLFNAESLHIVDSSGGLTVDGDFSGVTGAVEIVSAGDLTLAANTLLKNSGTADLVLVSRSGSFVNQAAVDAVEATGTGRILAYSDTFSDSTTGNLSLTKTYNHSYADDPPSAVTYPGDRLLLSQTATVNVLVADTFRAYGAANPTFSVGYFPSLQDGDTRAEAFSGAASATTTAVATSGVGEYFITLGMGTLSSNYGYEFDFSTGGTVTVNPATLTITPDDTSRLYGAADPTFTASFAGFVNGDTEALVSGLTITSAAVAGDDVGDYALTGSGASAGGNYAVDYSPGTLTINPAPLTITANDAARNIADPDPTFTALFSGLVAGDSESDITGLTLTTTATGASPAGTYPITAAGAAHANYDITFVPGVFTLTGAVVTVTADDFVRNYGVANPDFTATFTGLPDGTSAADVSGLEFSTTAVVGSDAGTYAITPFGATLADSTFNFVPGTLTIDPVPLTIAAHDMTRLYGAANPTFTASYSGLVAGDTADDIAGLTLTTAATTTSGVGDYTITAAGATSPNYTITHSDGTLAVDPAALTITADDQSRLYGAANPTLTTSFSGLVAGDTAAVVSGLNVTTPATTTSDVGTYAITPAGGTADNYTVSFVSGDMDVNPVNLTVTAADATRDYGAADPVFTGNITGFVAGDTVAVVDGLEFAGSAAADSDVGTYTITPSGASASNYTFSYVDGRLTITPAALTITADDLSRYYSLSNPTPTATYTGLVAGDTAADISGLNLSIVGATSDSDVGDYVIRASGATSANYRITMSDGVLQILPAPITVAVDDRSSRYGSVDPVALTPYLASNPAGAAIDINDFVATTTRTEDSGVGTYPITITGDFDPALNTGNYDLSLDDGVYTVTAAPLLIKADSFSRLYGADNPTFTGTFTGLVAGDGPEVVTGLTFTSSAIPTSPVSGRYGIHGANAVAPNYDITYLGGILTVEPAPLVLMLGDATRVFGDTNASALVPLTATGLVNGEDTSVLDLALGFGATPQSDVGDYPIFVERAAADNYTITISDAGTLTITPRPLTVTAMDITVAANDPEPDFVARFDGLANFHSFEVMDDLSFVREPIGGPTDGERIIPTAGPLANYDVTFVSGLLSYSSFPLVLTIGDLSGTYGAVDPTAFSVEADGLVDGDTVDDVLFSIALEPFSGFHRSVGEYAILAQPVFDSRYVITVVQGTYTVTPASVFIQPHDLTAELSDGELPTFTAEFTGLAAGETGATAFPNLVLAAQGDVSSGLGGEVPIVVTDGFTNPNYDVSFGEGILTYTRTFVFSEINRSIDDDSDFGNPDFGESDSDQRLTDREFIAVGSGRRDWGTPFNLPPSQLGILDEVGDFLESQLDSMDPAIRAVTLTQLGITGDIDAWIADLANNPDRQSLLLPFLAAYTEQLAGTPASRRTPTQQAYVEGIERSIATQRRMVADKAAEKLASFHAKTAAQGKGMSSVFGAPQWDDFVQEASDEIGSQIMQGPGAAIIGGAAGVSASLAIGSAAASIFPFAASGGTIAAVGAVAATGGAAIVAVSVAVGVVAAVQLSDQVDREQAFADIQAKANEPVDLNELIISDQGSSEVLSGLLGMMGGF